DRGRCTSQRRPAVGCRVCAGCADRNRRGFVKLKGFDVARTLPLWLPGYGAARLRDGAALRRTAVKRIWIMIADHFEPWWRRPDDRVGVGRVNRWCERWPFTAMRHADDAGWPPCSSFFYPEEQYHPAAIDALTQLVDLGIADVEVHLHHEADTADAFV